MTDSMSADEYNEMMAKKPKPGKYGNEKTVVDGIPFDSLAEARRYCELKHMRDAGMISDLELQPAFPLIVNGVKVAQYRADFSYVDVDGQRRVEDVKSPATAKNPVYRLKSKMVKAQYGIDVEEVAA